MAEIIQKLKSFTIQSIRVWKILKKPSMVEFSTVAKVSAVGVLVLGGIGFFLSFILNLVL